MERIRNKTAWYGTLGLMVCLVLVAVAVFSFQAKQKPRQQPLNVIFILSDDHRYDFMGFMNKVPGLQTPHMDRMAREGAHLQNAFVTTSLCSPSRASILTGQYAHTHTIVDNNAPLPEGLTFFPQYLQKQGYQTGFFGKWHMGNVDDMPQPGFDQWVSFKGQGVYYDPVFNINGKSVQQAKGSYTTDLLTDYTLEWLSKRDKKKPFFAYLSHKGVHAEFQPARRHEGKYKNMPIISPPSMYLTATDSSKVYGQRQEPTGPVNTRDIPEWVRRQRWSWHGVDGMYDGDIKFDDFYRRYNETLMSVDESIGRVLDWLKKEGLDKNTVVIYMGDNGFMFGEHGLIDKRHMYEPSIRVPLLVRGPAVIKPGTKVPQMVMNIDIAPTIMEMAGLPTPENMQGKSFLPILKGQPIPDWRDKVYYEYYWEWAFPQTPTIFGARTDQYKYIFNHGVWDINELYDIKADPEEMNNLIRDPKYQDVAMQLKKDMWNWLEATGGMQIPLKGTDSKRIDHLYRGTY
ncbi:sulfatase [Pontibacter sp. JH31]|uniref:Sulfatase n=1 Tax=Pontibacter aquaedesilientis TaxID=2766980 RepID=A0ABR7XDK6_9BACT|nr:sulfatase [Pontibacter aquaedesilientis]MBD1396378.1 sulfatase [Pontibacter aquaedesilientis]